MQAALGVFQDVGDPFLISSRTLVQRHILGLFSPVENPTVEELRPPPHLGSGSMALPELSCDCSYNQHLFCNHMSNPAPLS